MNARAYAQDRRIVLPVLAVMSFILGWTLVTLLDPEPEHMQVLFYLTMIVILTTFAFRPTPHIKWEYKVFHMQRLSEELLNRIGEDGWEATTIEEEPPLSSRARYVVVAKRKVR